MVLAAVAGMAAAVESTGAFTVSTVDGASAGVDQGLVGSVTEAGSTGSTGSTGALDALDAGDSAAGFAAAAGASSAGSSIWVVLASAFGSVLAVAGG